MKSNCTKDLVGYIHETFRSIDGECNLFHQGAFTTFIRFQGCSLRCSYCDTERAQNIKLGLPLSVPQVLRQVKFLHCNKVTITGGEPMVQVVFLTALVTALKKRKYRITLETNGKHEIPKHLLRKIDCVVMDYKLPSSGMNENMSVHRFYNLRKCDFVKFVIQTEADRVLAIHIIEHLHTKIKSIFALSPVFPSDASSTCSPKKLIEYANLVPEPLLGRLLLNVQIHKLINVS